MPFGSGMAVAVAVVEASSCSSNWTPSLGTYICHGSGPKKTKKKIGVVNFNTLFITLLQ